MRQSSEYWAPSNMERSELRQWICRDFVVPFTAEERAQPMDRPRRSGLAERHCFRAVCHRPLPTIWIPI